MLTSSQVPLLLLLLLAAPCFAQNGTPPLPQGRRPLGDDTCFLQDVTITCACRTGQEVLSLTPAYMVGSGGAEVLHVSGCSSVTFAFPPLQRLHTLSVRHTASATFQEKASPLLRHLALANVSHLVLQGPIFQGVDLQTVFFDRVYADTLPSGSFANLSNIQNVTFTDVHFKAIQQGAVGLQMVNNSEFTIFNSTLLGVEKSGIVVKGVTNFTMHESRLTIVGVDGLQLDAAGSVSITRSRLEPTGPIKLAVTPGASVRFVESRWQNTDAFEVAQQLLFSKADLDLTGSTFHCVCSPSLDSVLGVPGVAQLLESKRFESNRCDSSLCGKPAPMRVLASCRNQTQLQAACEAAVPGGATTAPGKASAAPTVTISPRAAGPVTAQPKTATTGPVTAKPNTATAIAVPVATALLLSVSTLAL